ncbi:hypothetical protein CCAX7_60360 [Capsulimonas corticalis]|uniref:Uncharacterized protein n=1 Tax=Capsulimonas corticalis TaxID=2219043 RepID=A0A402CVY9_9BACT|nr:hypothetical protein [Capsulimonas corticalis]BDI33985.1 hypothetical protein CCAX7_60360 [Capsulimonas corticalis]
MSFHVLIATKLEGPADSPNDDEEIPIFINNLVTTGWEQSETVPSVFTKKYEESLSHAEREGVKEVEAAALDADVKIPYVMVVTEGRIISGTAKL